MKLKELVPNKRLRKQLIQVMGKKAAKVELEKAYFVKYSTTATKVSQMFVWSSTPQGHDFWEDISDRVRALFWSHFNEKIKKL